MSASNDKKRRQEAGRARSADAQHGKMSTRTKAYIIIAVLVVLIVFVSVFNSNLFYTGVAAVNVDGVKYSAAEFNYYYVMAFNEYSTQMQNAYGDYYSLMMPSTTTSLRDQMYDSTAGQSWADFFQEQALENMKATTLLCREAEAEGYELSQEELDEFNTEMETLEATAELYGYKNLETYLVYCYGKGMDPDLFREIALKATLASSYAEHKTDSFEYTKEELADYYSEHAEEYDYITYLLYFVEAEIAEDDEETEADETVDFETAMADAAAVAEDFVAAVTDEQSFIDYARELDGNEDFDEDSVRHTTRGSSISDTYKEWLFNESRTEGNVTCISTGSEEGTTNGYYVLYFIDRDRNDYNAVNGYFAYLTPETVNESDYETDEEYESAVEESKEAAKAVMDMLYSMYTSTDKTYDDFVSSVESYVANLTGYREFTQMGVNDLPEAVSKWIFDEAPKEGDVEMLYDETYGYFLVYYSGRQEMTLDLEIADYQMKSEAYDSWLEENTADYTCKTGWTMRFTKKMSYLGG